MTIDLAWLTFWFDRFNRDYFGGGLPRPKLALSRSRTQLGTMACKRRIRCGKTTFSDYAIRLSIYYEQTERQFQNTLLHEMIHYSIAYTGVKDSSPHGIVFREMMNALNRKYGWEISVSARMNKVGCAVVSQKTTDYLVLALEMRSGECYFSVVNRGYATRINAQLKRLFTVNHFAWYISSDARFATYPVVRSLRGRRVSRNLFDEMLPSMRQIVVD